MLPIPRDPQPEGATGEGSTGMEAATRGIEGREDVEEDDGLGRGGPKGRTEVEGPGGSGTGVDVSVGFLPAHAPKKLTDACDGGGPLPPAPPDFFI